MRNYLVAAALLLSIFSCKGKKSNDNEKPKTKVQSQSGDFFKSYTPLKLPYSVTDTDMAQPANTDTISYSSFTELIPDTIFNNPFGKSRKLSIFPIGKIEQKGKESYFATYVKDKSHSAVYLSVFRKNKFVTNLPLVVSNEDDIVSSAAIDKKLSIVINNQWIVKNQMFYKRSIYAYNNSGVFTTVLTETNEDRSTSSGLLNPFDTFPKRNKYSGDYIKGKKNVLYLRDAKLPGQYVFFIHFESDNNDDECAGELRGTLKMTSDKAGTFKGNGDPCVLNFSFKGNEIKAKETGTCGNYRGIKCFFDQTYTRKKEQKIAQKRKK